MKIIFPDYTNCVTNLTNSILKFFHEKTYHESLSILDLLLKKKSYKNIVILLYDGMGANLIARNLPSDCFLKTHQVEVITAVFPPTTTASTTSILSGLNPCEHGWLGWNLYFKELEQTVTMFLNTKKDTDKKVSGENVSQKYFPYQSIIDIVKKHHKAYQIMPFGEDAYIDLEDMNQRIKELCKKEERKLIYAYCDEPDHTMHECGTSSKEVKELFPQIDISTKKLCESLTDTLVIVTADHGHIECENILLTDYPDIFKLLKHDISIEGRACAFFIEEGKKQEFQQLFTQYFGKDFLLYSKKEVLKRKLFGVGIENKRFQESLGDYLAVAITNKCFLYNEKSTRLASNHAGITEDEVLVPLIIYES